MDTALYNQKLKEDLFWKSNDSHERVYYMVKVAEALGEGRLGGTCYSTLFKTTMDCLRVMVDEVDDARGLYERLCITHAMSRLGLSIALLRKIDDKDFVIDVLSDILKQLQGILNPLKGLFLIKEIVSTIDLLLTIDQYECLAKHGVKLWTRWTRYGSIDDVEVREWEQDQIMYPILAQVLSQFVAKSREAGTFGEVIVKRFLSFLTSEPGLDSVQQRVLDSILDEVPKAIISKHLEPMLLAVVKLSPSVNIKPLLQRLIKDSFSEGGVVIKDMWLRVKEIIMMRPELDLNDSLCLCGTVMELVIREDTEDDSRSSATDILQFINEDLLENIQLAHLEAPCHTLSSILYNIDRIEEKDGQLIYSILTKMDKKALKGFGLRVLRMSREDEEVDWAGVFKIINLIEEAPEDVALELVQYHRNALNKILPVVQKFEAYFLPLIDLMLDGEIMTDLIIQALSNPISSYFDLYCKLIPLIEDPQLCYDVFANVHP